jgi:hypothetical protein
MSSTITISKHLAIELVPSTQSRDPALRLFIPDDPDQSFVVFLSEVHLLRDALAVAGARLTELESEIRRHRK